MRRAPGLLAVTAALLSGALVPAFPSVAAAAGPSSAYARVLHVYTTRGSIPSCQFTSQELNSALTGGGTYGAQYFADFSAAIETALEARASGACSGSQGHAGHISGLVNPGGTSLPPSITSASSAGVPAPIVLLAVVGGLLALATGLAAVGRARGWSLGGVLAGDRDDRRSSGHGGWPTTARHGFAEARYQAGTNWEAFVERLRR